MLLCGRPIRNGEHKTLSALTESAVLQEKQTLNKDTTCLPKKSYHNCDDCSKENNCDAEGHPRSYLKEAAQRGQ